MSLTSVIGYVRAYDSSATDGSGKTGLAFGDFTAKYLTQGGTLTSLTTETITTLGTYQAPTDASHIRIKELSSSAPCQGIYEVHFHNTQTAVAGTKLWLFLSATGAAIQPLELDLVTTAALPAAAAGASGGLLISGSNSGTTTLGALTVTGALLVSAGATFTNATGSGLTCSSSGSNGHGLNLSGNGSGDGVSATGGGTGVGAHLIGGSTAGQGLNVTAAGSNADGASFTGIGTGAGVRFAAGATGPGINVTTTAGVGISVTPTGGHALVLTGDGTSKHGMLITGGTAGTSDGLKAVAGSGGVPIRGNITGDVTGNLSGSVGSISGITFPTNFATLAIDGSGYVSTGYFGASAVVHTAGKAWALDGSGNAIAPASATTALQAIFSGITSLAQWLGLLAGKQTGNSTARTEVRATGAGSGTFDETTDSQEALRDRGDGAWLTATGFVLAASAPTWFPAHFTNATFASDGVFATAALVNAPSGGGGSLTAADVWAYATRTLTASSDPTAVVIAAAVWDLATSGHTTSGTFGAAMQAAGSSGDPWGTLLPGSYGTGTAGYLVGNPILAAAGAVLAAADDITVAYVNPPGSSTISVDKGSSYYSTEGRALTWSSNSTLDLGAGVVTWSVFDESTRTAVTGVSGTVTVTGTSGAWSLTAELTAAHLTTLDVRSYRLNVDVALANTHPVRLRKDVLEVSW